MPPHLHIDIVAPPFAGHLFPLLDLAGGLRARGSASCRIFSTYSALLPSRLCGLEAVELLPGREAAVMAIANPGQRVGSNPLRLCEQFRANMALMGQLRDELRAHWTAQRPDIVLADFTVPVAGLLAQSLDIPWWTGMASPCAIETPDGVPSYLGGWLPRADLYGRVRDYLGWKVIRTFKRSVGFVFARELRALGIKRVYRADGTEMAYSPACILAYGLREFELERTWPRSLRFIGPLTGTPPFPHEPPVFEPGKRHILCSLGTHLLWAKEQAAALFEQVAAQLPDCVLYYVLGQLDAPQRVQRGALRICGFFPYDTYLPRFDAAITHGGTGMVYSCLKAGVPMLVWPQDFDHFDHAARIVARGLGLRLQPRVEAIVAALRRLLDEAALRQRVRAFQQLARSCDPYAAVAALLR